LRGDNQKSEAAKTSRKEQNGRWKKGAGQSINRGKIGLKRKT
jgi:hypothetical protein